MRSFLKRLSGVQFSRSFFKNTHGATAIEYALIAAGMSVAIVVIVFALGDQVEGLFVALRDEMAPYF